MAEGGEGPGGLLVAAMASASRGEVIEGWRMWSWCLSPTVSTAGATVIDSASMSEAGAGLRRSSSRDISAAVWKEGENGRRSFG